MRTAATVRGHPSAKVAQAAAAAAAGLPADQVTRPHHLARRRIRPASGCGFHSGGRRGIEGARRAREAVWTREDDMTHDPIVRRPASKSAPALMPTAISSPGLHIISPSITARGCPLRSTTPSIRWSNTRSKFPYACRTSLSYSRQEIGIDVGYLRSVSHAPNCFAIECFLDELAARWARIRSTCAWPCSPEAAPRRGASGGGASGRAGAGAPGPLPGNRVDGGLHHAASRRWRRFPLAGGSLQVHKSPAPSIADR